MVKKVLTGNEAVAEGARLCRVEVIGGYEITPATQISELLSEYCAKGKLKAIYIPVESEHSAMATVIGASFVGARVFTSSSSHGTLLMHEMLHWAAGMRRPIVFVNVNRAVGLPWNIWTDQVDSLSQRDTGWLQFYCENSQETLDTIIMSYKIAEDPRVMLPVMTITEGFILSHTGEVIDVPDQALVDKYLPPYQPLWKLDILNPRSFGAATFPKEYFQMKISASRAMERAKRVFKKVDQDFKKMFGRNYGAIEKFHWKNPKIVLVTSGTITSTARHLLLNSPEFKEIGLLKIKMFRPFPTKAITRALKGVEKIAVIDRNISLGNQGIFCEEIKSALCNIPERPKIFGFIAGLGGVDVTLQTLREAIDYTLKHKVPKKRMIWLPKGIEKIRLLKKKKVVLKPDRKILKDELLYPGHSACRGCGSILNLRHVLRVLGAETFCVIPAGCYTLVSGLFPQSSLKIPLTHACFETAASTASGIRAALKIKRIRDINVLALAGDGATYDIGFGALSAAAERGDDIIYVCADNEAYMNTGIQRSGATPWGAWTTTTPLPRPKPQIKKPIVEIMAAHRIPYAATASIGYLKDLKRKIEKAKSIKKEGVKFINVLTPCPTGWRFPSHLTIEIARLAVKTRIFPLYEVENGERWIINRNPKFTPVEEYLKLQGRFRHLTKKDFAKIQKDVEKEWQRLEKLVQIFER